MEPREDEIIGLCTQGKMWSWPYLPGLKLSRQGKYWSLAELGLGNGTDSVVVGSTSESDVCVRDVYMSGQHFELRRTAEGKLELRDLGSKNGTVVGLDKVEEGQTVELWSMAQIEAGKTVLYPVTWETAPGVYRQTRFSLRKSVSNWFSWWMREIGVRYFPEDGERVRKAA